MEELLNKIGWSMEYFADRLEIDEHTVHEWKSGHSQGASYRIAMLYLKLVAREYNEASTRNNGEYRPSRGH